MTGRVTGWLRTHRSLAATATSGTVIAALVATVAVVSGGYSAQRLDLGDAAVWVSNETRQVVGRANTEVLELNTVVATESNSLDVAQQGATVLVLDRSSSAVDIIDPATAEVSQSVPLPPVDPAVLLAGDRTVIASDGDLWSMPTADLAAFDSASAPTLALGSGAVVSLDADGVLFSFTPATGDLVRVDTAVSDAVVDTVTLDAGRSDDDFALTSVGARWALLNLSSGELFLPGQEVDLSALEQPVLSAASVDGGELLVAHRGGLVAVPLTGTPAVTTLVGGRSADAAAPTSVAGCRHAAWADGSVWRSCPGASPETSTVTGMAGDARLVFQGNGGSLVLNDARNGSAWAVQQGNELIDNWDELIDTEPDEERVEENSDDTPPEFEKSQLPPVAIDDEFGARPGLASTLPALLNDYDPNDDVLRITIVTELPVEVGRLDIVANNQQVQLTLAGDAEGAFSFDYSISDGRGGVATATVVVTVREASENSAPSQVRATDTTVAGDGRVTRQVLGDWVDPDGDPFYLASAAAAGGDQVTFSPDGDVTFTDGGGGEARQVGLTVSDGTLDGSGTLRVFVKPSGAVPIIADTFLVLATAGAEITVSPLEHVRGGSGPLRLSSVPEQPDTTVTPDFVANTFQFSSTVVGPHYLEYAVTDGALTTTGLVRVDVEVAADANSTPITVPHTVFIRGQQASLVDVLATDIDPAGGVLLVTGTMNVPVDSGLRVEILEQRLVRVTLTQPLTGPATFNYRVSNGLADAEGTVTVIELPALTQKQAPIAVADTVSVRVGDAINIPVLANDEHPDSDPLSLDPRLATSVAANGGVLFTSGSILRYLAPTTAGNFTAVYRVNAPDGQFANAEVRISVREADAASNNPPTPKTVTARVLAGDTVRIPIPLSGIDVDGDSVALLGQETNPEKGAVTRVGAEWIDYESGDYSAGTDTFTYTVVDALGARATGLVRVGISSRLDGARNPIATPDELLVRPGSTVSVRVLENDSDPDGTALGLTGVSPVGGVTASADTNATATVEGDLISVSAPSAEGRYGFIYEIENERGGTSSTFLTVVVRRNAPLSQPDASDTRLTLTDVLDRDTITVDVLANVFFAEGPSSDLDLNVLPGFGEVATVTADKHIRVTVAETSQIIPFSVTHPDDPAIVSHAFIWLPGSQDALPQLRTGVDRLRVPSESSLKIDINDYVVAVGGRTVRLTENGSVRATHSDGTELVADDSTLVFRSAERYYGPASISFEVTDGAGGSDSNAHVATIVLPIEVTPRENQPPAFDGGVIEFEPDQSKVIDLAKLTSYPYPDDQSELAYTVLEPQPIGFSYSLSGQKLTLRATGGAPKGSSRPITIGVRDDLAEGTAGRIELRVVASTRPLAIPAADVAIAPRARTTVVDVLANDGAANPFPEVPLRVVAVRGLESGALPAGVSVTPSGDNSRLSFTVAATAKPADTTLQYQVADATNDPSRYAWGTVRISVQDAPDPVTNLRVTGFGDKSLSVAFDAGASNNSPITGYQINLLEPGSGTPTATTVCGATSCTIATTGNGQAHAARVSVVARNSIGLADATVFGDAVWSDVVPAAPGGLVAAPLDGGLRLSWDTVTPRGGGTAMRGYAVSVGGTSRGEVSATGAACSKTRCSLEVAGLANGSPVEFTVSARNDAYPALSAWTSATGNGTPFGAPRAGGVTATGSDDTGTARVAWNAFEDSGDPILGYYVQRLNDPAVPGGAQACTVGTPAPGTVNPPSAGGSVVEQQTVSASATSVVFDGLVANNGNYSFVVWGYNRAGCVSTPVASVTVRAAPGAVASTSGEMAARGTGWDYQITGISPRFAGYKLRAVDSAGNPVDTRTIDFDGSTWPREEFSGSFGDTVRFQAQGCTKWGACGPWSGTQAAPEPSVSFAVTGLDYDESTGVFSWTNGPANGPNPDLAAGYQCSITGEPEKTDADSANSCTLPAPAPSGTVSLTVTVNGRSYNYNDE